MKVRRFAMQLGGFLVGSFVLMSSSSAPTLAQQEQPRALSPHNHDMTPDQKSQASAFVKLVRESTERFRDVSVAMSEEYALMFGCVSGPDSGAMGLHYVNLKLVMDGELDPTRPEIVIYEPLPDGRLRLIGADFLVVRRRLARKEPDQRHARARRTASALLREPESLRPPAVLHAARLGLEGQPDRHVRELAFQGVVRRVQRTEPMTTGARRGWPDYFVKGCTSRPRSTMVTPSVTTVASGKNSQRIPPPRTSPPSSLLSPRLMRTTPAP